MAITLVPTTVDDSLGVLAIPNSTSGETLRVIYDAKQRFTMDVEESIGNALEFANLLNRYDLEGEFFICGSLVQKCAGICRRIAQDHILGGHGFHHENFSKMRLEDQYAVIIKTRDTFEENGITMDGWRFPQLNFLSESMAIVARLGVYDSSLRTRAIELWGRFLPTRNMVKNIVLNHVLSPPLPFPEKLVEKPFSVVDIENKRFYEHSGRIMTHCYNYPAFRERFKLYLESIYG